MEIQEILDILEDIDSTTVHLYYAGNSHEDGEITICMSYEWSLCCRYGSHGGRYKEWILSNEDYSYELKDLTRNKEEFKKYKIDQVELASKANLIEELEKINKL